MFLFYVMWRPKTKDTGVQVVLQLGCGPYSQRWHFHRSLMESGFGSAFEEQLSRPETVYLCLASAPMATVQQRRARTLVVATPQPRLYGEFEKENRTARLYMPPWSWPELQFARRAMFPSLDEAQAKANWRLVGRDIRYALAKPARQPGAQPAALHGGVARPVRPVQHAQHRRLLRPRG